MIKLYYHRKKYFLLPDKFEELSGKQFIALAPLLYNEGDELQYKVKALRILSGLSTFRWLLLKPWQIEQCLAYVEWFFQEQKITKQLLPSYKAYHGPASDFDNLVMKEFHMSERYYRELLSEKEDESQALEHLNNLVAVLYRRPKKRYNKKRDKDGDIRLPFNHNETPFHAAKIAKWPMEVKQAIFLWYDGCRQELIDNNPRVFKEPSKHSFESEFDTGLYGIIRSLAGEKLGPVERVENLHVHHAMLEIGLIKEEEAHVEQQLKSKK